MHDPTGCGRMRRMASKIPSAVDVQKRLSPLGHAQIHELALLSGVPFGTLWKVKVGDTKNPGVETIRKFWEFLPPEAKAKAGA